MKKNLKVVNIFAILILILSSFYYVVNATEETISNEVSTSEESVQTIGKSDAEVSVFDSKDAWVYKDVYKCSNENLELKGIVDGNVFIVCGKELTISGEIGGDAFIVADKVTINKGYIYSNLFIVANELVVNGITYDVYGCCKNLTIGEQGVIARDIKGIGNNITINGSVYRNCYLSTEQFAVGEKAKISGSVNYYSDEEATIPEGVVGGDVSFNQYPEHKVSTTDKVISSVTDAFNAIFFTLMILVVSLLLSKNNFVDLISDKLTNRWGTCIGYGFAALIGIPVISILFLSMGCSAIIGLVLLLIYSLLLILSSGVTTVAISNLVCKKFNRTKLLETAGITALVALVLWIIKLIPFIGGLVSFATVVLGLGLLMFNILKNVPERKKKQKVVEVESEEEK